MKWTLRSRSLRRQLLVGILVPIALFVFIDTYFLYQQTLGAVNIAYDRTLLASAKAIGESLELEDGGAQVRIIARVPNAALEPFETDNRSRMVYRVSSAAGLWIDGAQDLPAWRGTLPKQGPYAALVDFYDAQFRGDPVRVAVLLQPIATGRYRAMATVQVAETLELRRTLAKQILLDTLMRQAMLIGVITLAVLVVVHQVTLPVRRLSQGLRQRHEDDLTPIKAPDLPREILPLTEATNQVMQRLQHLLQDQKRFVRDAAHQLRTPLAVLKVQVQSALRGDIGANDALQDIQVTVDRATVLANQMLSLAKVEQLRQQQDFEVTNWTAAVREVALDLSTLIAEKDLDFELVTTACTLRAHEWMLRELVRNLLHNAIRHSPIAGKLTVTLSIKDSIATLVISDSGPGITPELRQRLFQPFSTGDARTGSGLGLMIAHDIVLALNGAIELINRTKIDHVMGLDVCVCLPLAPQPASPT
jgi:two-component system sensor histidine kinase TctE